VEALFTKTPVLPSVQTPLLLPGYSGHGLDRKAATLAKRDGCLRIAVPPFSGGAISLAI
jgi:hypothetical protein